MQEKKEYMHKSLLDKAKTAGLWIDVADKKTMRGRESGNTNNKERVSRALSWYARSETSAEDDRLIFAFIAFNALYSAHRKEIIEDPGKRSKELQKERNDFFAVLKELAKNGRAGDCFDFSTAAVKKLEKVISSQYIMPAYWKDEGDYLQKYRKIEDIKEKSVLTEKQIRRKDFIPLEIAIRNIYELRNQIFHGMAACNDSYNRKQVKLCADVMHAVVGRILSVVINNPEQLWGDVGYPPQGVPNDKTLDVEKLKD